MTNRQPTHPGEILREDVLPALGMNASQFAECINVSRQYLSDILNAKKAFTPLLSLKVAKIVGNNAELWMNMQTRYDLWVATENKENRQAINMIRPAGRIPTPRRKEITVRTPPRKRA